MNDESEIRFNMRLTIGFIVLMVILIVLFILLLVVTSITYTNNTQSRCISMYNKIIASNILSIERASFDTNPNYISELRYYSRNYDYFNEGFLLRDFYIAGSNNSICLDKSYNDFISLEAIEKVIKLGARSLELNIFNSSLNDNGIPVCASYNSKLSSSQYDIATLNYISLQSVCQTIKANAFSNNINDPLFLILNLNYIPNAKLSENITKVIYKNFKENLLDAKYSYQKEALGDTPINKLKNKIVIICSKNFKGTPIDELVNVSWDEKGSYPNSKGGQLVTQLDQEELDKNDGLGAQPIIQNNKKYISFLFPSLNRINNKLKAYNTDLGINLGFNIIHINYFKLNEEENKFIEIFKKYSIVLKPKSLRKPPEFITYSTYVNPDWNTAPRAITSVNPSFSEGLYT